MADDNTKTGMGSQDMNPDQKGMDDQGQKGGQAQQKGQTNPMNEEDRNKTGKDVDREEQKDM